MLFTLCMVLTAVPFSGAANSQNNGNNVNLNADLGLGISSAEIQEVASVLKEKDPYGEKSTEKILGENAANDDVLKLGANGEKVKNLQQWLLDYGFYAGKIDGIFGTDTETALKLFQQEAGIQVDGWVGKETQSAMDGWDEYLAQQQEYSAASSSSSTGLATSSARSSTSSAKSSSTSSSYSYRGGMYTSGAGVGDCWTNSAYLYNSLTASGQQARVVQYATSYSANHRSVQVYSNGAWVDYDYAGNGYSWGYYATSGSSSGTVVQ
jgi:N-acetylmuramoyl-L-alanine amidase